MPKLSQAEKELLQKQKRHADVVRMGRLVQRIVKHTDPKAAALKERKRLEKSPLLWLKYYGGEAFDLPWSPDHRRVIGKMKRAVNHGGLFALAMSRGEGKTTIVKWLILYVLLTGRRKYVFLIAAEAGLAELIIEFCRVQITENERLHEHYPHVTSYARATDGKAIKARYQLRADGKPSGMVWSKSTVVLPEVVSASGKPYLSNGSILEARGLTGAIRGKWRDTKTGKVLRPDFVVLEDPQTRESAESVSQCNARERIIKGDVLGLAGPRKKIAAIMPCTVIRKGDVADRFLDHTQHPEWQGERTALVKRWPKQQDGMWQEYARLYRDEMAEGRGMAAATAYYKRRRKRMDVGAKVSWKHRVRDGELSALQTAENLLIEMGPEAFWAEMQNDPRVIHGSRYELTPQLIVEHMTDLPRLQLPDAATVFCGHCDVNHAGLHYCLSAFGQDMTGHSPMYGRWPERGPVIEEKNASEREILRAIFVALKGLCDNIEATVFHRGKESIKLQLLLIDVGYKADAVQMFCKQARYSFRCVPAIGRDATHYKVKKDTLVGKPFENCHVQKARKVGHGPYLMFQADEWRETAQRAFLGTPGEPGGYTLHKAANKRLHLPFAEHCCAEKLLNKYETESGMRWEWAHQPGSQWDWGDAYSGSWAAGAALGLSASGDPIAVRVAKRKRSGITVIKM